MEPGYRRGKGKAVDDTGTPQQKKQSQPLLKNPKGTPISSKPS